MSLAKKHPSSTPSGQKLILRQLPTSRMGRSANQPCVHHLAQGRHGVVLPPAVCRSSSKRQTQAGLLLSPQARSSGGPHLRLTHCHHHGKPDGFHNSISQHEGNGAVFSSLKLATLTTKNLSFTRLLQGSWVAIRAVISRVTMLVTGVKGLITPLITTHEPPSRLSQSFKQQLCPLPPRKSAHEVFIR